MTPPRSPRRRPAVSWPAAVLPGALLAALLAGATTQTAGQTSGADRPVIDMTVSGTLGR